MLPEFSADSGKHAAIRTRKNPGWLLFGYRPIVFMVVCGKDALFPPTTGVRKMHGTHSHGTSNKGHTKGQARPVSVVPPAVQNALRDAIKAEKKPETDFDALLWIMAQESAGVVNARNTKSTARGLFQLLHAQYSLNPRGEASFGNALEECQGGIRYIYGRYHTAYAAKGFWQRHHWY
jgi:hypothetical protein